MQQNNVQPCFWMKSFLNRMVEGDARGPFIWYAKIHLRKCKNCTGTYKALLHLQEMLRQVGAEPDMEQLVGKGRWERVLSACQDDPPTDLN